MDNDRKISHYTVQQVVHTHFDWLGPALCNAGHVLIQRLSIGGDQPGFVCVPSAIAILA